jgi:hypothetical protein
MLLMEENSSFFQSFIHIKDFGQGLQVQPDQIKGPVEGVPVLCNHQGHGIPAVPDPVVRKHRLVLLNHALPVGSFDVFMSEDSPDAWKGQGPGPVNPPDTGMRDPGPLDTGPHHVFPVIVRGIRFCPRHLGPGICPEHFLADLIYHRITFYSCWNPKTRDEKMNVQRSTLTAW